MRSLHYDSQSKCLIAQNADTTISTDLTIYLTFYLDLIKQGYNFIFLTTNLWPKSSVDFVSDSLYDDGEQQITIVVLQFPPNES